MNWKWLSFTALGGLVACIFGLYLNNYAIFGTGPITITIQVIAALLMVWARLTFGIRSFHGTANPTAGGLVTTGPYRYIRHPIYAAILYFFWAGIARPTCPWSP
jgi:protein-S-isoprenylcysteine O-methyltransferase Ste14